MKTAAISIIMGAGAFFIPNTLIDPIARAIVPAIALMATGIFPCMTLAINSMKAEGRTPKLIEDLHGQLYWLLRTLAATFALAVAAIAALTVAIALAAPDGWAGFVVPEGWFAVAPAHVAAAVCGLIVGVLGGRVVTLGRAFFTILEINKKQALLVARPKVRTEREEAIEKSRRQRFVPDDQAPRILTLVNEGD